MRNLLFLVFLAVPHRINAQGLNYVQETAISSGTIFTIGLSTSASQDVSTQTANGKLSGAYAVEVYNIAGNPIINCSYDTNVSTASSSNLYGREINAGSGMVYHILEPVVKLWCLSQANATAPRVTITQLR